MPDGDTSSLRRSYHYWRQIFGPLVALHEAFKDRKRGVSR